MDELRIVVVVVVVVVVHVAQRECISLLETLSDNKEGNAPLSSFREGLRF